MVEALKDLKGGRNKRKVSFFTEKLSKKVLLLLSVARTTKRKQFIKRIVYSCTLLFLLNMLNVPPVLAEADDDLPVLVSEAAIVVDADNGSVLFEKEADTALYPASLTKIATAIYAIENGNLDEVVTVSDNARNTEGTKVYLETGEQVTLKKLIQGLLINSGNDAGVAIAEHLSGSIEQYAVDINEYLRNEVGVQHSTFKNPHGLFDPEHVTTAEDLAAITRYAMQNETFREIFGTKELKWVGESWDTTLYTHHKLMWGSPYEGVTGGKTGYVDQSGVTLATTAEKNGLRIIVITLKSNTQAAAYTDTVNLLDYSFENFQTAVLTEGTTFTTEKTVYKVPEDYTYTHLVNEEVSQEVTADGKLTMTSDNGLLIASFLLEDINSAEYTEKNSSILKETEKNTAVLKGNVTKVLLVAAAFTLCIVGFLNRKPKNHNRYKKAK